MTGTLKPEQTVLRFGDIESLELIDLLARYELEVHVTNPLEVIPRSYWGDEEAGLIGHQLFLREDTPIHSALHEACHFICMNNLRRQQLETNAGNNQQEEEESSASFITRGERRTCGFTRLSNSPSYRDRLAFARPISAMMLSKFIFLGGKSRE